MLLETIQCRPPRGTRILVKPNLLTPKKALATTHPLVVQAVCEYLLDYGARVSVGDSPAFGTAKKVANANGLAEALNGLPIEIINLSRPTKIRLASGISIGISQKALDTALYTILGLQPHHVPLWLLMRLDSRYPQYLSP
jgi:uncharacterized protein (DUF362 family)